MQNQRYQSQRVKITSKKPTYVFNVQFIIGYKKINAIFIGLLCNKKYFPLLQLIQELLLTIDLGSCLAGINYFSKVELIIAFQYILIDCLKVIINQIIKMNQQQNTKYHCCNKIFHFIVKVIKIILQAIICLDQQNILDLCSLSISVVHFLMMIILCKFYKKIHISVHGTCSLLDLAVLGCRVADLQFGPQQSLKIAALVLKVCSLAIHILSFLYHWHRRRAQQNDFIRIY